MASKRLNKLNRGNSDNQIDWMTTYSDMVTLLLTFFVMLFSMATIDKYKFEQIAKSLRNAFLNYDETEMQEGGNGQDLLDLYNDENSVDKIVSLIENNTEKDNLLTNEENIMLGEDIEGNAKYKVQDIKEEIEQTIQEQGLSDYVGLVEKKEFLIIRFKSIILFDLSSADIRDSAKDILLKLGNILNKIDNEIIIQGHTDNLPINTSQFPSNWELSTRRATNVVHFLIENCGMEPSRLTATGNAEFKPIKPNDTPENRQQNRRIDIVISKLEEE